MDFERYLIPPKDWAGLRGDMPKECLEIVDGPPDCVGVGKSPTLGWFVAASGQGPAILWSEQRAPGS